SEPPVAGVDSRLPLFSCALHTARNGRHSARNSAPSRGEACEGSRFIRGRGRRPRRPRRRRGRRPPPPRRGPPPPPPPPPRWPPPPPPPPCPPPPWPPW